MLDNTAKFYLSCINRFWNISIKLKWHFSFFVISTNLCILLKSNNWSELKSAFIQSHQNRIYEWPIKLTWHKQFITWTSNSLSFFFLTKVVWFERTRATRYFTEGSVETRQHAISSRIPCILFIFWVPHSILRSLCITFPIPIIILLAQFSCFWYTHLSANELSSMFNILKTRELS